MPSGLKGANRIHWLAQIPPVEECFRDLEDGAGLDQLEIALGV
jgi:hypothetical protein